MFRNIGFHQLVHVWRDMMMCYKHCVTLADCCVGAILVQQVGLRTTLQTHALQFMMPDAEIHRGRSRFLRLLVCYVCIRIAALQYCGLGLSIAIVKGAGSNHKHQQLGETNSQAQEQPATSRQTQKTKCS
jgi:hypothetical protein